MELGSSSGQQIGVIRSGQGEELFAGAGCLIKRQSVCVRHNLIELAVYHQKRGCSARLRMASLSKPGCGKSQLG